MTDTKLALLNPLAEEAQPTDDLAEEMQPTDDLEQSYAPLLTPDLQAEADNIFNNASEEEQPPSEAPYEEEQPPSEEEQPDSPVEEEQPGQTPVTVVEEQQPVDLTTIEESPTIHLWPGPAPGENVQPVENVQPTGSAQRDPSPRRYSQDTPLVPPESNTTADDYPEMPPEPASPAFEFPAGSRVEVQSYKSGKWLPAVVLEPSEFYTTKRERLYTLRLAGRVNGRILRRINVTRMRGRKATQF